MEAAESTKATVTTEVSSSWLRNAILLASFAVFILDLTLTRISVKVAKRLRQSFMAHVILPGLERRYNEVMDAHKRELFAPLLALGGGGGTGGEAIRGGQEGLRILEIGAGSGANFKYGRLIAGLVFFVNSIRYKTAFVICRAWAANLVLCE